MRVPPYSTSPTGIASGLSFPGGFAAGPGGTIYVSNWSVIADPGSGTGSYGVIRTTCPAPDYTGLNGSTPSCATA
jgi:hypothetical protein